MRRDDGGLALIDMSDPDEDWGCDRLGYLEGDGMRDHPDEVIHRLSAER